MKCPNCKNEIQPEWKACPLCGDKLPQKKACTGCGKEVDASWKACPFCGNQVDVSRGDAAKLQDVVMKTKEFIGRDKIVVEGESQRATKTGEFCHTCGTLLKDDYFRCLKCDCLSCSKCHDSNYRGWCVKCGDLKLRERKVEKNKKFIKTEIEDLLMYAEKGDISSFDRHIDSRTVDIYKEEARIGNPDAMFLLGRCYARGLYVKKSEQEAVRLYKKGAEQGHVLSQVNLGVCYYDGRGVSIDKVEAVRWYRKAADQGNAEAQFMLGLRYGFGGGVSEDKSEAVKWLRKAADQGHLLAQYALGLSYYLGDGVSKDKSEAVKWYRKAADQGYARAQHALGLSVSGVGPS